MTEPEKPNPTPGQTRHQTDGRTDVTAGDAQKERETMDVRVYIRLIVGTDQQPDRQGDLLNNALQCCRG